MIRTRDLPADLVQRLVLLAAARLLLRHSEPGLSALVRLFVPSTEPATLAARVAHLSAALFAELASDQHALARIARGCDLSSFDLDLLGLAIMPCLEDRAADAVLAVAGQRRLPGGLALRILLGDAPTTAAARASLRSSPLWRYGLLQLPDPLQPPIERLLDPNPTLLALLDDDMPTLLPGSWSARPLAGGDPPASLVSTIDVVAAWLLEAAPPVLHLVGDSERGAAVLAAAAHRHGLPISRFDRPAVDAQKGPPWCDLALVALSTGGVAAAVAASGTGEFAAPAEPPLAPVALLGGDRLNICLTTGRGLPLRIAMPPPDPAEQADAWQLAMPNLPSGEAEALGNQTWMSPHDIATIAARAGGCCGIAAARLAHAPPRPLRMARVDPNRVPWTQLVLDPVTAGHLEDAIRRYRLRVPVRFRWGMAHAPLGLVIMLSGESGTGKTLIAAALATRLALPLVRVDLSLVVSKYIGETEKNLAELFDAAEGFAALLFFDEADALFGKRTAIEDAHDRYANIEVNFLLQRLETFEGIAVLATNASQRVDAAFLRRFELVLSVPRPGPSERYRLWQAHLPGDRVDPAVDLAAIAERFDMTGGEIRNAALTAAYAAADACGRITCGHLMPAIRAEFTKKGHPAPAWPTGEPT